MNLHKKIFRITTVFLLVLVLPGHDYWFEARPFIVDPGDWIALHLMVGDDLKPELERPFEKGPALSFVIDGPNGTQDLLPLMDEEQEFFSSVKITEPGFYQFSLERDFSFIAMSQAEFLEYLRHEEIEDHQELVDWMQKNSMEKERYARSVKTLIAATGDAIDTGIYLKPKNHPYEIVLKRNPYLMHEGDTLGIQVLKYGKAAPDMVVMAQNKTHGFSEQKAVTNGFGEASFKLEKHGMYVIRSLWLRPCPECDTVDWESHWASYSFYLEE